MKKSVFVVVLLIGFVFFGCDLSTGPSPLPTDPSLARVVIPLPGSSNARAVGLPVTIENTNYFGAYFRRTDITPNTFFSAEATLAEGSIELNVPVGIYDILLFAGRERTISINKLLLASAYAENRNIVLGPNYMVMELATIDVDMIVPEMAAVSEYFDVVLEIKTKNPLLSNFSPGWINLLMDGELAILDGSHSRFSSVSMENNIHKLTATATAPNTPQESILSLQHTSGLGAFGHSEFTRWDITAGNYSFWEGLQNYFVKPIAFFDGADIEMFVTWPNQ